MPPLILTAPAKLNLTLQIKGKRPDGYHELRTLMVKTPGLEDRLTFTPAENFSFTCDDSSLPTDESNLVVKAVRAFEAATGLTSAIHLHLEKNVPHGAGLGGGSSDASSTLHGLNDLHGQPLDLNALATVAGSLGSDIPFFLTTGPSICSGRGEIVQPGKPIRPFHVLLLKPAFGVSTLDAYGRYAQDSPPLPGITMRAQTVSFGKIFNDLERPVFAKHRFLAELKQWLIVRRETYGALMSGSGSTVFAVLKRPEDGPALADAARAALDPTLWSWCGTIG